MRSAPYKKNQQVIRNPEYHWCVCGKYRKCFCLDGVFTVEAIEESHCQSGYVVTVEKKGSKLEPLDSSYFVKLKKTPRRKKVK